MATAGGWDVFLSHDWGEGELGNNHERVVIVAEELRRAGLVVWMDKDGSGGGEMAKAATMGQAMADGIAKSKVVVVCVTKKYSDKVDMTWAGTTDKTTDNCLREFNLSVLRHGLLGMLPAVMEPGMQDLAKSWGPRLQMELGEMLFENLAVKEEDGLRRAARKLADRVRKKINDPKSSLRSGAGARAELFKIPFSSNVFMAGKKAREFAPGTRQWILERVADWYTQAQWKGDERVFVLLGAAAVGKSTLAAYLAQRGGALLDDPKPLLCADQSAPAGAGKGQSDLGRHARTEVRVGAIHMFNFGEADRSDLVYAFMSISEQLCAAVPGLARELASMRQTFDPQELRKQSTAEVFRALVALPCVRVPPPAGRVLVVIDALDECSKESRRKLLHMLQVEGINETPDWLGFLVTSRPEDYIPHELEKFKPTRVDAEKEKNEEDMCSYLRFRLGPLVASKAELEQVVAELTRRSEGTFLFARFLDEMLGGKAQLTLADLEDELAFPHSMKDVLRKYFGRFHGKLGGLMYRALLMPMAVAREPLPKAFVRTILLEHTAGGANKNNGIRQEREVTSMINKAQNLLYFGDDGGLRFVHKSMAEWLTDEANLAMEEDDDDLGVDEMLAIDPVDAHAVMAERLVGDREDRFALRHVLWHLWHAGRTDKANELLLDASWVLAALHNGVDPMDLVLDAQAAHGTGRKAEVDDVLRVLELGAQTLRQDPLQLASQLYGRLPADHAALLHVRGAMTRPWLRPVTPTLTPARSPLRKILRGHEATVMSVAVHGDTIVSSSQDKTVRVWRAADGACLHVLKGHDGWVHSVAIQGGTIVSGSEDKTVRVWRTADRECLHVLKGHDGCVRSVAVQSDMVVSGSEDKTVRVWRAADGECLHVLRGHCGMIWSVAIQGDTIVSGSEDKTVRAWRAADGECLHVLEGHDREVWSVAIQDDTIVSGSDDKTVRVWRAADGASLHVLKGHDATVMSVVVQGDVVVSGSLDKSVRVWRAADGACLHVLKGHDWSVRGVAVQGDTIVSGSLDKTVRVWRAADGECLHVLEGHDATVMSVAIQGDTIVSGSDDKTVRVWRAADGECLHVLNGHDNWVTSVNIEGDTIVSQDWDGNTRRWPLANLGLAASGPTFASWVRQGAAPRPALQFTVSGRTVELQSRAPGSVRAAAVPFTFDDSEVIQATCSADVVVLGMKSGAVHILTLEEQVGGAWNPEPALEEPRERQTCLVS